MLAKVNFFYPDIRNYYVLHPIKQIGANIADDIHQ